MRLFVAVELDERMRQRAANEQARIRRQVGDAELKWVRPELMHVTLVFIGNVEERRSTAVLQAMNEPVPLCPFDLEFGGVGVFPERGAPRVLWLGARAGADEAVRLQRLVAERLEVLGIPRDSRPFHPHLTLARWRDGASRTVRARVRHAEAKSVGTVHISRVTLFSSKLSTTGPAYTALTDAPLECP